MRKTRLTSITVLAAAVALAAPGASAQSPAGSPSGRPAPAATGVRPYALPLAFEEHRNRPDAPASFVSRGPRHTLTLTPADAALTLGASDGRERPLRMTLVGSEQAPRAAGLDPLPGRIYHATRDSRGALSGHPTYRRVKYPNVYPGVDLVYYGNDRQLEFDFLVASHADPRAIHLEFSGADTMMLEPDGELAFQLDGEDVRLKKPVLYQDRGGRREPVDGGYRIVEGKPREVAFRIGEYDESRPLVIDPTIVFATYRGGVASESPRQVKVNALGEVYLFADTEGPDTLPLNHANQRYPLAPPQPGFAQCFLTKISRDGRAALYTVIFEGAGCQAMDLAPEEIPGTTKIHLQVGTSSHYQRTLTESQGGGLTLDLLNGAFDLCQAIPACGPVNWLRADANGNVYFILFASPTGPPDFSYDLVKVDGQGHLAGTIPLIQPSTHPSPNGPTLWDQITGFDIDEAGNAYVIGYSASAGVITPTTNALQSAKPSGNVCNAPLLRTCYDGFVLKVATETGTPGAFNIAYASYLGGGADDRPFAVAWDGSSSDVYVAGTSNSFDFPMTPGSYFPLAPSTQYGGASFLVKIDLAAPVPSQLVFSTLLTESGGGPTAISVLPGGMAAVVGQATDSTFCRRGSCFPSVNGLYPPRLQSETRPFLSVLSADGATLPFSTFLDDTAGTFSFASNVASNGSGTVYVAIGTNDPSLATAGALQTTFGGGSDALVQAIDLTALVPANDPPLIAFSPSTIDVSLITPTTGAIFPLFCGPLFTCSLVEPDGEYLTHVAWFDSGGIRLAAATGLPAQASAVSLPRVFATAAVGTHAFTLVARDERGGIGTGTVTVNVSPYNTIPGPSQRLVLTDARFVDDLYRPQGSAQPIELTLANVTSPGLTWLESRSDRLPPPPPGLQAGSPPYYYDVHSTATFSGTVNVCVNTRGMSFARAPSELSIYALVNDVWARLGNQAAPTVDQICADAASLGTFAIFYPQVPETAITTIAGTGVAQDSIDGFGGDPSDDAGGEFVPAVQSPLTRPGPLAASAVGLPHVYAADNGSAITGIRRITLSTGIISTVVPAGVCYGFGPLAVDPADQFLYCTRWDTSTGLRDIVKYDLAAHASTAVVSSWSGEVSALALDAHGNLFFADGVVYRVPTGGGAPQALTTVNSSPGVFRLPYADRFTTLAFDATGHLLAGGQTLIRIAPGADGLVEGSPDEGVNTVAGIPGANLIGYSEPFGGDGLPATQAMLAFSYQMTVAADGAVVFTDQGNRIRRIDPGADGVVNGGADEMVRTIAGYFSSTLPTPSGFATSEYGNFVGVVEEPLSPDRFIVSSREAHKLQRFGIPGAAANQPPVVSIRFPPATVSADSPLGGTVSLNAVASDPDGDLLIYSWTGPFIDTPVTTDPFLIARLVVGSTQTITVTVSDGHGGTASASVTLDVTGAPFIGTTATPVDAACSNGFTCDYTPITVTAAGVPAGTSHVFLHTRTDQNPPIPSNLQAGSPPMYFDLSTDAAFLVTPIDVCIDTRGMSFPAPSTIRLYQYQSHGPLLSWTDITQSANLGAHQLCGRTNTLGTFAIFYPQVPATAIRTIAGNGTLAVDAGTFIPGPATSTPLGYLAGGAYDRARNALYLSELTGFILRLDLNTSQISRVAGNGVVLPGSLSDPADLRDDIVDGGDPFLTFVGLPFEMTISPGGDLVFFDRQTCRIRRLDLAHHQLFNVAGNGTCGSAGDGGPATSAAVNSGGLAFDAAGNLFVTDGNNARIRRIDAITGIITTAAGDGTFGIPVTGTSARSTIGFPHDVAFDGEGHLIVAAGMDLLRISPGADGLVRGDADDTITVLGGCHTNCTQPFGGDGLPVSHPQVFFGDIGHVSVSPDGALIVSDRFRIRRVAPGSDGIVRGAADEVIETVGGYYDTTPSVISNFNGDTFATQSLLSLDVVAFEDNQGRILVVDTNHYRVRRIGLAGSAAGPPTLTLPQGILAEAQTPTGAVVTFAASAADAAGTSLPVSCTPASGSTFSFQGAGPTFTLVNCSASDAAGATSQGSFFVTVQDTTPPAVTVPSAITIAATEMLGARSNVPQALDTPLLLFFLAGGTAADVGDPNPARQPSELVRCSDPSIVMQPVIPTTLFAVGQNCVRFTFSDRSGNAASALASFEVKPPIGGFINTAGVAVVATDLNNIPQPVSANFTSVQQPGLLTATPLGPPAPLPPAFSLIGPAFEIRSTALAPLAVVVCLQQPGLNAGDKLFLFENGAWVDRTATVDTARSEICGLPTTPGVFIVGRGIPAIINVTENIVVTDGVTLLPSAMIGVSENIVVSDVPALLPSAVIGVSENIVVSDAIGTTVTTPPPNLAASKQIMVFVVPLPIPGGPDFGTYQPFSTATVKNGDTVLFRLAATNLGGATTGPIIFTDTLAPGLTFLSSDSGCTAAGQVVTCTIAGPVAFNQEAAATISAQLDPRLASRQQVAIENRVTVATAGDTDAPNNTSSPVVMTVDPPPFFVPADITTPATSAAGAIVTYSVNSFEEILFQGGFGPPIVVTVTPVCSPASGSTFPIGTTTVTCSAFRPGLFGRFLGAGSFTVTVTLGAPAVSATVVAKGRDVPGSVFLDLRITNTGTGHARNVSLGSIVAQRLNGVGSVAYDAARSGALPIQIGSLDVAQTRVVRLYFTAPATVTRFSITVNGGLQNLLGVGATFSIAQTIIP